MPAMYANSFPRLAEDNCIVFSSVFCRRRSDSSRRASASNSRSDAFDLRCDSLQTLLVQKSGDAGLELTIKMITSTSDY